MKTEFALKKSSYELSRRKLRLLRENSVPNYQNTESDISNLHFKSSDVPKKQCIEKQSCTLRHEIHISRQNILIPEIYILRRRLIENTMQPAC